MSTHRSIFRRLDHGGIPLLIIRMALGAIFIYMGTKKIGHPYEFLKQIRLYHMLPENPPYWMNMTAIVLPWIEVVCGVALMLGVWIRGAAVQIAIMLAVFTPAIFLRALAIRAESGTPFFDIAFDCGCGAGVVVTWKKLLENSGLFLLALLAVASQSRRFTLTGWLDRRKANAKGA